MIFFIEQSSVSPSRFNNSGPLGTNEALDHPYFDPDFPAQTRCAYSKIESTEPNRSHYVVHSSGLLQKKKTKEIPV